MPKILIVDDDLSLSQHIKRWLEFEHYIVEHAATGTDGLSMMMSFTFDVVVLDVNLPQMSGFEVCQNYRDSGGQTAVLMLTSKADISDKELGYGAGVDDYLAKPFNLKELSLRIRSLLKRSRKVQSNVLEVRHVKLDPIARRVEVNGSLVELQNLEFQILELLLRSKGNVLATDVIIERTSNSEAERTPDSLRTAVKKLRKKIDLPDSDSVISNVHGIGYAIFD